MSEWDKDPEVQEWMRDVVENMVPKLEDSAITLSLCPAGEGDPKYWVELGAAIMLDKPIIVLIDGDREIPERLQRVADEVVRLEHPIDDPRGAKQMHDAIERVLGALS